MDNKYYTESKGNITIVKIKATNKRIGTIEKPYRDMNIFMATGWNGEILSNNGNYIFRDAVEAKQRIINHYLNEINLMK